MSRVRSRCATKLMPIASVEESWITWRAGGTDGPQIRGKGRVVNISSAGGKIAMANLWSLRRHEVRARSGQ